MPPKCIDFLIFIFDISVMLDEYFVLPNVVFCCSIFHKSLNRVETLIVYLCFIL